MVKLRAPENNPSLSDLAQSVNKSRRIFLRRAGALTLGALGLDSARNLLEFNFGSLETASSVKTTVLTYNSQEELINTPLLVLGDSSVVRPGGEPTSIADLINDHLDQLRLGERQVYILSKIGASIPDTLNLLGNPSLIEFIRQFKMFDVLFSLGPDNMKYTIRQHMNEVYGAEQGNFWDALTLESNAMDEIHSIQPGVNGVLSAIYSISPYAVQKFSVLGAANYSNAKKIVMANANGTITGEFLLKDQKIKDAVANASLRIDEQIGNGAQDFADQHPNKPVQLVSIYDLGRESFRDDEHFNLQGRLNVTQRILINWEMIVSNYLALNLWTNRIGLRRY